MKNNVTKNCLKPFKFEKTLFVWSANTETTKNRNESIANPLIISGKFMVKSEIDKYRGIGGVRIEEVFAKNSSKLSFCIFSGINFTYDIEVVNIVV